MDEREVTGIYLAEMRALLSVLQHHLNTLGAPIPQTQYGISARELTQLAGVAADLSADFHAEDCAMLAAVFSRAFAADADAPAPTVELLAPATDAITYLQTRVARMESARRVLAASEAERATAHRVLVNLCAVSDQPVPGGISASDDLDDLLDLLPTEDEPPAWLPVTAPLGERPLPPPTTAPLSHGALEERLAASSKVHQLPRRTDPPADVLARSAAPLSAPGAAETAATSASLLATGPAQASVAAASTTADTSRAAWPARPSSPDEPLLASLTEEDAAILREFHARPLRRSMGPAMIAPQFERTGDEPSQGGMPTPALAASTGMNEIDAETHSMLVFEITQELQKLQQALVEFEQRPDDRDLALAMQQIAHKIKGTAGTFDYPILAEVAHEYEELLHTLQSRRMPASATTSRVLLQSLAEMEGLLAAMAAKAPEDPAARTRMRALVASLPARATGTADGRAMLPFAQAESPTPATAPAVSIPGSPAGADVEGTGASRPGRPAGVDALLSVDVRRLDTLMHHVNTLAVNRAEMVQARQVAEDARSEMERILTRLNELVFRLSDYQPPTQAAPTEAVPASPSTNPGLLARVFRGEVRGRAGDPPAATPPPMNGSARAAAHWDELELERFTEYDQMTRALTEAVADATTSTASLHAALRRLGQLAETQEQLGNDIQQSIVQVRLVPLSHQMTRLRLAARKLAEEQGKRLSFTVQGEMTEIDRDVSEALVEALTQVVRNAVTHGIETPEERSEYGKPEQGRVWLHAYHTGNEVNIEIGDDGRGINPELVKAAARVAGAIDADAARTMSADEAVNLIFEQGISTVGRATVAAGHGIGLAEVHDIIARLRGTIEIHNVPGEGTTFHIRVPISLSIVRALHVRVGSQGYAVPFASVLHTMPVSPLPGAGGPLRQPSAGRRIRVKLGDEDVELPLYALAELLGQRYVPGENEIALVVMFGRQRAALAIDGIVGHYDVVVRSLPAHLQRRAVRGATVTPGGEVLLLLDLPELAARALRDGQLPVRNLRPVPRLVPPPKPRVLVVDDSLSMRHALEAALTRAGYDVQLAHDGLEALEMMLEQPPAMMVLDIEMPRLDGFELLSVLQAQEQFAALPVIVLTSRGTEKHRRHAEALGANAYLVKPCPAEALVESVRQLLAQPR